MKKTILTAVFVAATSMSQLAVADAKEARERLDSFFTKVSSLKGSFKQQVFDKRGKAIQNSTGLIHEPPRPLPLGLHDSRITRTCE